MKYYKITDKSIDLEQKNKNLVADIPSANGEFVPNGKEYFDRIGAGEIIKDCPVLDYFHLQSYGPKEEWEWRLQDVHGGMGEYPRGAYWYISDKCKKVLENFSIIKDYHFYPTKLLYKGEKLDYWIFQFSVNFFQNINYQKSEYYIDGDTQRITHIKNENEYRSFSIDLYNQQEKSITWKCIVYKEFFDFIENFESEFFVSENLKKAIEENNITGFEFSELDYEVIINDNESTADET